MNIIEGLEREGLTDRYFDFRVGDTVDVFSKIVESGKERVQRFTGVVIAQKGGGITESFTVRRIVQGKGVEKSFTIHSPLLVDVKVTRLGRVRRAKLYYLRDRTGRSARPTELILSKADILKRKEKAALLAEKRKASRAVAAPEVSADTQPETKADAEEKAEE